MFFQVIGKITRTETIAVGSKIREIGRLKRIYGPGRWRKRKGIADIRLRSGQYITVELHWYEAHGIGKKEYKIKRILKG
jgi:hypothetical protein